MSQKNVEVVRRVIKAFETGLERGDPSAAWDTGLVAEDLEWITGIPGLGPYRGREEWLEFMRTWTEDFEGWSIETERVIDAGDNRVVALNRHLATGKGSGVPSKCIRASSTS
jgi:ketosteroid isomerase-like protein